MNATRQTACMVVNKIMVDNFACLFYCTLMSRAQTKWWPFSQPVSEVWLFNIVVHVYVVGSIVV